MLWKLTRKKRADYDENVAFIVRADSPKAARKIANEIANEGFGEGKIWEDSKLVKCERIQEEGKTEIIMIDFKAG